MQIVDHTGDIVAQLAQLADCISRANQLTEGIIDAVAKNLNADGCHLPRNAAQAKGDGGPILDRSTFTVQWAGKICYLGNTLPFRLMERLTRRPNRLVPCEQLLDDVWQCCRSREAMRSVVKVLRQKLVQAGMEDLATAIDGKTARHYGLILNGHQ